VISYGKNSIFVRIKNNIMENIELAAIFKTIRKKK